MADRVKLLVLGGPTATGKTALAVALAQLLDGEVISADSMQIYRGLPVGTAAPTEREMQGVPHHLIGFLPPEQPFSVAQWTQMAAQCIDDIAARGKTPIVAGGTGLYLTSLVKGVRFAPQKQDPALRRKLEQMLADEGAQALYRRLCELDPDYAKTVHPNHTSRVLRALEVCMLTGGTVSRQLASSLPEQPPYDARIWALNADTREALYRNIDRRVDAMLQAGLLREARWVYDNRQRFSTAAQAIGYKEFFGWFEGEETLEVCTARLKQATRRYAKRQLTWLRHMDGVQWERANDPLAARRIADAYRTL